MTHSIAFTLNGRAVAVAAAADTPLLHVLRNLLGLKGARYGCGAEQCGSCTVLLDGRPVFACSLALDAARGRSLLTIEGLGSAEAPHPIQQAFLDEQAGQCGYCLAGMVMRSKALLDAEPDPSRAAIAEALDGNLCRCGAHHRILRAVARAAALLREGRQP